MQSSEYDQWFTVHLVELAPTVIKICSLLTQSSTQISKWNVQRIEVKSQNSDLMFDIDLKAIWAAIFMRNFFLTKKLFFT